jgi:hypothetical protein
MKRLSLLKPARAYPYDVGFGGVSHHLRQISQIRVNPLAKALISSKTFRRLEDIRFLGGIDYLLVKRPNGSVTNRRYTRYEHSVGVGLLSLQYCRDVITSEIDTNLILSAALLHDIGHCALSHTLEPSFSKYFGIDHHEAAIRIIMGRSPYGPEILNILRSFSVDPEILIGLMSGELRDITDIFYSPINIDTIEGILRCRSYLRRENLGLSPKRVLSASIHRNDVGASQTVDTFWELKGEIYNKFIQSRAGLISDEVFRSAFKIDMDAINPESFYWTESKIFSECPTISFIAYNKASESEMEGLLPPVLRYKSRNFFVDETVAFETRRDAARYRQSKSEKSLTLV